MMGGAIVEILAKCACEEPSVYYCLYARDDGGERKRAFDVWYFSSRNSTYIEQRHAQSL